MPQLTFLPHNLLLSKIISFIIPLSQWKRSFYILSEYVSGAVLEIVVLRWGKLNMFMYQTENLTDGARMFKVAAEDGTLSRVQVSYSKLLEEATKLKF